MTEITIQIDACPDGIHCGKCKHGSINDKMSWCYIFKQRLEYEAGDAPRCSECISAERGYPSVMLTKSDFNQDSDVVFTNVGRERTQKTTMCPHCENYFDDDSTDIGLCDDCGCDVCINCISFVLDRTKRDLLGSPLDKTVCPVCSKNYDEDGVLIEK